MKSCATMLKVTRSYVIKAFGIRIWKSLRCGYFITMGELNEFYMSQGFNHVGTAMRRHLTIWMSQDAVALEGPIMDPTSAVWFECPEENETLVKVRSEQCYGRYVTVIKREDWKSLMALHSAELTGEEIDWDNPNIATRNERRKSGDEEEVYAF